ncbi:BTB/POZ domain-containing protein [Actinidia rufa]|uniref:BTB/POZ domain-containing protein n=1 Tax=Actinidia rufa TaxID=165716 RepID=A0A7J0EDB9_9ERIC|nr:BTB/POZ domain-containing protein [Actinidia rufa]
MKDMEDELNEKLAFLGSFVTSFRDQIHTDIQVKPSNNGPPIRAHRALLAARSEIFKNILDSDGCKAPPNDLITNPRTNSRRARLSPRVPLHRNTAQREGGEACLLSLHGSGQVRQSSSCKSSASTRCSSP